MSNNSNSSVPNDSGLRNKSLFNLFNAANQHLEVFKSLVLWDLEQITPKKDVNPHYIQEGIQMLEKRKDVIIR